jgi:biotin carboxylase
MVGFSEVYLRSVDGRVPARSITVLEEPDLIRRRGLAGRHRDYGCLADIVPAAYQQETNFLETGLAIQARTPIDAVVPGHEYAVTAAATLAAKLGLPGATEPAAAVLRDKLLLREAATRAGLSGPEWTQVHGPDDIVAFAGRGPVVVKPANRQASLGVHVLERVDFDLASTVWSDIVGAEDHERVPDRPLSRRYLAERRLCGPEYSVEALVRDGQIVFLNVTEKAVLVGVHPVELGHVVPAPIDAPTRDALADRTRRLVHAVGFGTGILHAEWILTTDGPSLVECAGRCPGDRITDLIELAYGFSIRLALLDLLAGRRPELPVAPHSGAAIRFLGALPGRVRLVTGLVQARALPGVAEVSVTAVEGGQAHAWTSSWDRSGHVLATGPDAATARDRAIAVAATIRIVTG